MRFKRFVKIYGFGYMLTATIVFMGSFLVAWFNPSKTVLIDINGYGEATLELILLILAIPCVGYLVGEKLGERRF